MAYLQSVGNLPAFQKLLVSGWFMMPAASVAAANTSVATDPFAKKIPILVFGKKKNRIDFNPTSVDVMSYHWPEPDPPPIFAVAAYDESGTAGDELPPCYVAVDCSGGTPLLVAGIQTNTPPTVANYRFTTEGVDGYSSFDETGPNGTTDLTIIGDGVFPTGFGSIICASIIDVSYVDSATPAKFSLINSSAAVLPDVWHHFLLSVDLTPGCATEQVDYPNESPGPGDVSGQTSSAPKMYWALDGNNFNGANGLTGVLYNGDPNEVLPDDGAWEVAHLSHTDTDVVFDHFTSNATYALDNPSVEAAPVGIPASSDFSGSIYPVRMAELQMWAGIAPSTADLAVRRLFIGANNKPVPASVAAQSLGPPDVKFSGAKNWQAGNNGGSIGPFNNTGPINPFSPGPAD